MMEREQMIATDSWEIFWFESNLYIAPDGKLKLILIMVNTDVK